MTERPIIFSGKMVRAILDGRKTQTRRVISGNPGRVFWDTIVMDGYAGWRDGHGRPTPCPYGVPGDRLWVRETFDYIGFSDDGDTFIEYGDGTIIRKAEYPEDWQHKLVKVFSQDPRWRPSIHMPRWASRIDLEITDVRVERLRDISWRDAISEGVVVPSPQNADGSDLHKITDSYRDIWDSINAKRGHPWASNPLVWVVEFERAD